jgi:cation transport ATPase
MIVDVAVDTVGVGDLLMVKPAEVIPVDGPVRGRHRRGR